MSEAWTAPLDRAAIEAIIPHRDPFLLVDEIIELEPGERAVGRYHVTDEAWYLRGHFPGRPIMPGVLQVEALAQVGAVCGLSHPDFAGGWRCSPASTTCASSGSWCRATRSSCECEITRLRGPVGKADAEAHGGRRAGLPRAADLRPDGARGVIAACQRGRRHRSASASYVPERVMSNDEIATMVETSDEWIAAAHRHPRAADRGRRRGHRACSAPRPRAPRWRRRRRPGGDRPDRRRDRQPRLLLPGHRVADRRADRRRQRGRRTTCRRPAPASSTRWPRATRRSRRAWPTPCWWSAAEVFSRLLDWSDRSTCILFGDGAGAVVLGRDGTAAGLLGFELGADGTRRRSAVGARGRARAERAARRRYVQMNGPEVYKFATRVVVESAERCLEAAGSGGGGRRRVPPAPGEQADHRPRGAAAGHPRGARVRQRRALRQHVGGIDPARPRRGLPRRAMSTPATSF